MLVLMMRGRGQKGHVERKKAAAGHGLELQNSRADKQLKTKLGNRLHLTQKMKRKLIPQSLREKLSASTAPGQVKLLGS